jgi:hypothetical protein
MSVSGAGVGLRGNFMAFAGAGGGGGVDGMLLVDVANMSISGDVVPFAEVGVGVEEGAGFGVVLGYRISPHGEYGDQMRESYSGPAINAGIEALAGLGFSISPGLIAGDEGWATICISLGEQFGASVSVSYGVSAGEINEAISNVGAQVSSALSSFVEGVQEVGEAISATIDAAFKAVFSMFYPDDWDLSGFTPEEQATIRQFGHYMNEVIAGQGSINDFLGSESADPTPSISDRINEHSTWDIGLMIATSHCINAKYHRMEGGTEEEVGNIWEPVFFNDTSYLNFLAFMKDNALFN